MSRVQVLVSGFIGTSGINSSESTLCKPRVKTRTSVSQPFSILKALTRITLVLLFLSVVFAAVPIRLYENVQPASAAIPNTVPTTSASTQGALTYSKQIPGGFDGWLWSWYDAGSPTPSTEPNIRFFKSVLVGSDTYVKIAAAFTGVEKIKTSLYLETPKVIIAGTDTGLFLLWLDTYDPLLTTVPTLASSAATAIADSGKFVANMRLAGTTTVYVYWTAATTEASLSVDYYRLFRIDTSTITFGSAAPTAVMAGAFTTTQSSASPLIWTTVGDYLFVFRTLDTDPGLFLISPGSFTATSYAASFTMTKGFRYVAVDQNSPDASGIYTLYGIDYTSTGTYKPGTAIHQFTFTYDTGTLANSAVGTLVSTTITGDFVSTIIQIKNTKYVAAVVGTTPASAAPVYSVRVFDTQNSLAEVTTFTSLVLTDYQPWSLELHGDPSKFTNETPFTILSTKTGVSTVRTFFFLTDACKSGSRTSNICSECQTGYNLYPTSAADNECYPQAFERAATSLATVPASCKNSHCMYCSSATVSTCLLCQTGCFRSEGDPEYSCYKTTSEIEDGFGYNSVTQKTSPCTPANNCKQCRPDYQTCESCAADALLIESWSSASAASQYSVCMKCVSGTPFIKVTNLAATTCVASNTVTGFGLDTSQTAFQVLRACSASLNCLTCFTNMNSCQTCAAAAPYLVTQSSIGTCYTADLLPNGFGVDKSSATPKASPCASGCKVCKADNTVCTECLATAYKALTAASVYSCYLTAAQIPAGWGPDATGSLNLVQCSTSIFCATCTTVFDQCSTCATGRYLYTPSGGKAGCYGTGALAIPDGTGPDKAGSSNTLLACLTSANCLTCATDNRYCITCPTGKYLLDTSGLGQSVCVAELSIPAGYGADKNPASGTQQTAKKCTNVLCNLCQSDYTKCTECLPGTAGSPTISYLAPSATSVNCWAYPTGKSNLPATTGLDKTNTLLFVAKPCAPASGTSCTACIENYVSCDSCAASDYKQTVAGISNCYGSSSFPIGFGPNLAVSPQVIVPCDPAKNCERCDTNYLYCSTCSSSSYPVIKYIVGTGGTLMKERCLLSTDTLANWGKDPAEANSLKPCAAANSCTACPDDFNKCTTCATGQYLLDDGSGAIKCITSAQIPAGKGAEMDAVSGTQPKALNCLITSCAKCFANYKTSCTECTGVLYLSALGADAALPRCIDSLSIPEGYRGTTDRRTEACLTSNCAQCSAGAATCTKCKSTFYLHAPDGQCYTGTTPIPGYRFDSATSATQKCPTGCDQCTATAASCEACSAGLFINAATCYTFGQIPDGFGVNNGNMNTAVLAACSVTNCQKCASNHAQCNLCLTGKLIHFDGTSWSCVSALPTGYGNDPSSSPPIKTIKCRSGNCDACATDYTKCTLCTSGTSSYLEEISGTCYTKAQFPSGFGLDSANTKVVACTITGCDLCVDDFAVCTKCQNSNGYYMKGTNFCIKKSDFAAGEGVNIQSTLVEPCTDPNCSDCKDDNSVCAKCNTSAGFYLLKPKCISKSQIAAGQGINQASGTVENCASNNCVDCFDDFKKCVKCTDSVAFVLSAGYCYDSKKPPAVDPLAIRVKVSSASVQIPLGPDQSRVIDQVTIYDLLNGIQYSGAELGLTLSFNDDGMTMSFSTSVKINKGKVRIDRRPTVARRLGQNSRLLIDASPIVIDDFVLIQSSWVASLTQALQILLSIFRLPASIILFWKYPWTAMLVDTLANHILLLGLFKSESLAYPRLVFEAVAGLKVLPFRFTNPFLSWGGTTSCTPIDSYSSLGFYCSWLDNYGENFIALLALALLAAGVHFGSGFIVRKTESGTKSRQAAVAARKHYGIMFWLAKVEANHLEILLFTLVSYAKTVSGGKGVVGLLFGSFFLVIVISLVVLITKLHFRTIDQTGSQKSRSAYPNQSNPESTSLQGSSQQRQSGGVEAKRLYLEEAKAESPTTSSHQESLLDFLSFTLQNREEPTQIALAAYYPIRLLRALLLSLLLLNLFSEAWVQLMLATILESVFLLCLLKQSRFTVKLEHYTLMAIQSLTILYLILKAISTNQNISDTGKYGFFNNLLAIVLILILVIPLITVACAVIDLFYAFMKPQQETMSPNKDHSVTKQEMLAKDSITRDPQMGGLSGGLEDQTQMRNYDHHVAANIEPKPDTASHQQLPEVHTKGLVEAPGLEFGRDDGCFPAPLDFSVSFDQKGLQNL